MTKKRKDVPKVSVCPKCNTSIDEYYGFCRPCFNKYSYGAITMNGYPLIIPTEEKCTYELYGKHHMIQHWFHCNVCDVGQDTGRCLACSISCQRQGHTLIQYYGAFFCDEGFHNHLLQLERDKQAKKKKSKCTIL